jgi:uncharacterized membrane protein
MNLIRNTIKGLTFKQILLFSITIISFLASILFVYHNDSFYDRTIAKVVDTQLKEKIEVVDSQNNKDQLFTQSIIAEIKNGELKGERIYLMNEYSASGAFDQDYEVGNEVFISIDKDRKESYLTGTIYDLKRDKYIVWMTWIFIFILVVVGKKQGVFSIVSLAVNAVLLSYALDVYLHTSTISLLLSCGIAAVLFTVISLLLVNGVNEKTYAAIIATLLGTFISFLITSLVMWITKEEGLHYEEMQFLTRPPQMVFMAGMLVGSLGAVMDVAITMSSSIFTLYEQNPQISMKALKTSAMDIGRDIMGTMTNILFFAYVSGSIPMLILYMKNGNLMGYTLSMNLSLELARAFAGGIGIVLAIPFGLYTSILFINRKRAKQ